MRSHKPNALEIGITQSIMRFRRFRLTKPSDIALASRNPQEYQDVCPGNPGVFQYPKRTPWQKAEDPDILGKEAR